MIGLLLGEQAIAVVLHLMQTARPGGRMDDQGWLAGLDEAGRQRAPGARRSDAPQVGDRAPAGQTLIEPGSERAARDFWRASGTLGKPR